jgi:hypothetical protein
MSTPNEGPKPRLNETSWAIIGAAVISLVLATVLTGNPFRAVRLAYLDYAQTPAGGAPIASTTEAPKTSPAVQAQTK